MLSIHSLFLLGDTYHQTTIYNKNLYDCIVNDDCGDIVVTYEGDPDSSPIPMVSECDACKQNCTSEKELNKSSFWNQRSWRVYPNYLQYRVCMDDCMDGTDYDWVKECP